MILAARRRAMCDFDEFLDVASQAFDIKRVQLQGEAKEVANRAKMMSKTRYEPMIYQMRLCTEDNTTVTHKKPISKSKGKRKRLARNFDLIDLFGEYVPPAPEAAAPPARAKGKSKKQ